jgi:hypothetical protein
MSLPDEVALEEMRGTPDARKRAADALEAECFGHVVPEFEGRAWWRARRG